MRSRFLQPAHEELRLAVRYYSKQRPELGKQFRREVQSALRRIREFPEAWQQVDEEVRRCSIVRFPYGILFTIRDGQILVLAVMHLHRDPDYWRSRLALLPRPPRQES